MLRPLWLAVSCGAAMLVVTTIQGALREGFDSWHQAVSALSLGPGGWIQMLNLVVFGAVVLATAPAWRRVLARGRGATVYPTLIAVIGASFVAVGLIPQDPAPGYAPAHLALHAPTASGFAHLAIAGVAALSSIVGLLVMAARFAGDPAWRRWTGFSIAAAVGVVGCVTVYAVWSVRPSGFAGTFERAAIAIPMVWTFAFLRRLQAGTPFMVLAST